MHIKHFPFAKDLLKHYVRTEGWLPSCSRRKEVLANLPEKLRRRLRYFTFCAVDAIDVLMLDVAGIIRPSEKGQFDTVVFFDKDNANVDETYNSVPGSNGFPADFVKVVLYPDTEEDLYSTVGDLLDSQLEQSDTLETREKQRYLEYKRSFFKLFPFDVINLDLETYLFKPNDQYPGELIRALKKILIWQQNPLKHYGREVKINSFSLMFTTRIGPPAINPQYLDLLKNNLYYNLQKIDDSKDIFIKRTGTDELDYLQENNFDLFFKLGVPKVLMNIIDENDWYVDPKYGVKIFEYERTAGNTPYKIIHLVMDVIRKNPPSERRGPRDECKDAEIAYQKVAKQIFSNPETIVTESLVDKHYLQNNLSKIESRRKKYLNCAYNS